MSLTDCPCCDNPLPSIRVWDEECNCRHCKTVIYLEWDYVDDYSPAIVAYKAEAPKVTITAMEAQ
jgi:hypothetical protein